MSHPSISLRLLAPLLAVTVLAACQTTSPPSAVYSGPVLPIQQVERGVEIFLPSAALFETGKSALNATEAGPYLDRIALLVTTKSDKAIALEGHADNVGSVELNQKLSDERAAEIGKALVARGVPTARIRTAVAEAAGLVDVDHARLDTQGVLQRDRGGEEFDILGPGEHEKVATAVQVDLLAWALREVGEEVERALAEHDVELVGEVGSHAAGGLRGRPRAPRSRRSRHPPAAGR